ncbi:MAG: phosphoribosyl-AMP cyclohydrolase [Bacteroidota bacterium]
MNELEEGSSLSLQFDKRGGLLPVVVQDVNSLEILMLGYANREAFQRTLDLGMATFYSTSRQKLWTKGETSGDYLKMANIKVDCDQDAIVYQVIPQGKGACHTGRVSCFYRSMDNGELTKD